VLERLPDPFEVILVDDGSSDGSDELLDALAAQDPRVRTLHFSRNFGHQAAFTAGMDVARGDAVVLIDGDLQDPPELIPAMLETWRSGNHVVYGVRRTRRESPLRRLAYGLFYRSLRAIAEIDTPLDSGDFCLMDRQVVQAMRAMPERNRFLRGLRSWTGFRQTGISYDREARTLGESKYTLRKLVRLALSGYVGFSLMPLRIAGVLGFLGAGCGLALAAWAVTVRLLGEAAPPGWASTFAAILFVAGMQLLVLGIIGEYLGRVYDEVRRRPLYILRDKFGFEAGGEVPEEAVPTNVAWR
jgi:dolichol-phosphate mannosyltransferase